MKSTKKALNPSHTHRPLFSRLFSKSPQFFIYFSALALLSFTVLSTHSLAGKSENQYALFCESLVVGLQAPQEEETGLESAMVMPATESAAPSHQPAARVRAKPPQSDRGNKAQSISQGLQPYFKAIYGNFAAFAYHRPGVVFENTTNTAARLAQEGAISIPTRVALGAQSASQMRVDQADALKAELAEKKASYGGEFLPEFYSILVHALADVEHNMKLGQTAELLSPLQRLVYKDGVNFLDVLAYSAQMDILKSRLFQFMVHQVRSGNLAVQAMAQIPNEPANDSEELIRTLHEINVAFFSDYSDPLSTQTILTLHRLATGDIKGLPQEDKNMLLSLIDQHNHYENSLTNARKKYAQMRNAAKLAHGLLTLLARPDGRAETELGNLLRDATYVGFSSRHAILKSVVETVVTEQLQAIDSHSRALPIAIPELGGRKIDLTRDHLENLSKLSPETVDRLMVAQLHSEETADAIYRQGAVEALQAELDYLDLLMKNEQSALIADHAQSIFTVLGKRVLTASQVSVPQDLSQHLQESLGKIFDRSTQQPTGEENSENTGSPAKVVLKLPAETATSFQDGVIRFPWLQRDELGAKIGAARALDLEEKRNDRDQRSTQEQDLMSLVESLEKEIAKGDISNASVILKLYLEILNQRAIQIFQHDFNLQLTAYENVVTIDQGEAAQIKEKSKQLLDVLLKIQHTLEESFLKASTPENPLTVKDATETMAYFLRPMPQLARILINQPGHNGLLELRNRVCIRSIVNAQKMNEGELMNSTQRGAFSLQRVRSSIIRHKWKIAAYGAGTLGLVSYFVFPSVSELLNNVAEWFTSLASSSNVEPPPPE